MNCLEFTLKYSENISIKTRAGTIGTYTCQAHTHILKANFHNCTYTFLEMSLELSCHLVFYLTSVSALLLFWMVRNLGGSLTHMASWLF